MLNTLNGSEWGPYSKETPKVESLKKFNTIFSNIQEGGNAGKIYIDWDNGISIDAEESSDGNEIITITEWIGKSNWAANGWFELIKDKNWNFKKLEGTTNEEVTYEEVINKIIPEIEKKIRDRNDYLMASTEFDNIFSNIKKGGDVGKIYKDWDNEMLIDYEESDGNQSIIIAEWVNKSNWAATSSLKLIKDKKWSFVLEDGIEKKKLSVGELSMQINNLVKEYNNYEQNKEKNYADKILKKMD